MWRKIVSRTLDVFKFLMAISMMVSGVQTMLVKPLAHSHLGLVYETKATLVAFGILFFVSGALLFIGKAFKRHKMHGWGLYLIALDYTFGFILNWIGLGWSDAWVNGVFALIMSALYLRWKYHIYYYEPKTTRQDALESLDRAE